MKYAILLSFILCSTLVCSTYIPREFDCTKDGGCVRNCAGGDPDCSCVFERGTLCTKAEYCIGDVIASWESEACCRGECSYADPEEEIKVLNLKDEVERYDQFVENQKVVDLVNYSAYQPIPFEGVSIKNDFLGYILLGLLSLVILISIIYLVYHVEGESFIEFWERII